MKKMLLVKLGLLIITLFKLFGSEAYSLQGLNSLTFTHRCHQISLRSTKAHFMNMNQHSGDSDNVEPIDSNMQQTYNELERYLRDKLQTKSSGQYWVGIAGPPASGKSTIAQKVCHLLNRDIPSIVIPMDGYHYYRHELDKMPDPEEAHRRRGAPWTFDASKFTNDLKEARQAGKGSFPSFDHGVGDPVQSAIELKDYHQIILVEGNYLMLSNDPAWKDIQSLFDETWFVRCDVDVIRERIIKRHIQTGKPEDVAIFRANYNDVPNAELILSSFEQADKIIQSL
mmetsp:Transcript_15894/g.20370  ORF Transcript_15894/g.20370 Transcript_15894/m.20370 type:complete len:284 (+) Transcript_15894:74-925(+)